jgi:type I restriction enzyme S subunit
MELKPDYKKTEIGSIPEEWDVKSFGDLFDFRNGVNADKQSYGQGVPFINVLEPITYSHIHGPEIPGRVTLPEPFLNSYEVRRGDVLFNRTSETQEEVGLASTYLGSERVVFGGFVICGRPKDDSLDPLYSGYALRAPVIRSQIIPMGQGAIRANISQQNLKLVLAPVPPPPEQQNIASTLSDMDALLEGLERLIAKKRDLKQAAMQQLLTGQTRLPGFSAEWKRVELGDLFTFKNGLNKAKEFFGVGTPIVNYMDVFGNSRIYFSRLVGRVSLTDLEMKNFDIQRGDVLFTRTSETPEEVGMAAVMLDEPQQTVFSGFVLRGRPKNNELCDAFKAYCFQASYVRRQIISKASYTTRALTNGKILSSVVLLMPSIPEQAAIANVLTDMDEELAALEHRLTKTRDLKQAMMQELLTGRTRLVAAEVVHA